MSGIFEFLFKYRPVLYQEGDFSFLSPWPLTMAAMVAAALAVPAVLTYLRARGKSSRATAGCWACCAEPPSSSSSSS